MRLAPVPQCYQRGALQQHAISWVSRQLLPRVRVGAALGELDYIFVVIVVAFCFGTTLDTFSDPAFVITFFAIPSCSPEPELEPLDDKDSPSLSPLSSSRFESGYESPPFPATSLLRLNFPPPPPAQRRSHTRTYGPLHTPRSFSLSHSHRSSEHRLFSLNFLAFLG